MCKASIQLDWPSLSEEAYKKLKEKITKEWAEVYDKIATIYFPDSFYDIRVYADNYQACEYTCRALLDLCKSMSLEYFECDIYEYVASVNWDSPLLPGAQEALQEKIVADPDILDKLAVSLKEPLEDKMIREDMAQLACEHYDWTDLRDDDESEANFFNHVSEKFEFVAETWYELAKKDGIEPFIGYRYFECPGCCYEWKQASRDCLSPSGENCPKCNEEWIHPYTGEWDDRVPHDEWGNLTGDQGPEPIDDVQEELP